MHQLLHFIVIRHNMMNSQRLPNFLVSELKKQNNQGFYWQNKCYLSRIRSHENIVKYDIKSSTCNFPKKKFQKFLYSFYRFSFLHPFCSLADPNACLMSPILTKSVVLSGDGPSVWSLGTIETQTSPQQPKNSLFLWHRSQRQHRAEHSLSKN